MSAGNILRNLLLGKDHITSRSTYKYAMLRGQLGLLLAAICVTYIIIDTVNGVSTFIFWYILTILAAFLIILLNRLRKYLAATILILVISNVVVYFFAAVDNPASGVFIFFVTTSATALVLFSHQNRKWAYLFIAISLVLGFLAFLGDWSPIPPPYQSAYHLKVNFITNFILGLTSSILIIYFIITRNHESETTLLDHQKKLEYVSEELKHSRERFVMAVEGTKPVYMNG